MEEVVWVVYAQEIYYPAEYIAEFSSREEALKCKWEVELLPRWDGCNVWIEESFKEVEE